tara:strand:- start:6907 stop:7542 length:636 start_codon:yes stop_codon:yes gene_type:complete
MIDYLILKKNHIILLFTIVYLIAFTANAFFWLNFEFLYYTVVMSILIYAIVIIYKRLHLASFILVNLSLLGFFHLLGGNFYWGQTRLYDLYFLEGIIRYDNLVHTYATFIATLTLYSLLNNFIDEKIRSRYPLFALGLILMALGMGAINELLELFAVLAFGVTQQVGDYFNNAFDILFNTIGASLATVIIYFYIERPRFIKKINAETKPNN